MGKRVILVGLSFGFALVMNGCLKTQSESVTGPRESPAAEWLSIHDDPLAVAQWLISNPISESQLDDLSKRPIEFHLALVDHVMVLNGARDSERTEMLRDFRLNLERKESQADLSPQSPTVSAACDQPIEYRSIVYGATTASRVTSWDSANGKEYTFYFWPSWTDSPDDIRWASAIGWVTYCIWTRSLFSNGGIAGHHLCSRYYEIQLGNGVMKAIGFGFRDSGVNATFASLYLHHQ